ncbi:hypothetical protein D3C86_1846640 [compost metagenome]
MDEGDTTAVGVALDRSPLEQNATVVQTMDTGKHFDQSRFTRAILPEQSQYAAGLHLQADIIDCQGSAKALADIFVIQKRQGVRLE